MMFVFCRCHRSHACKDRPCPPQARGKETWRAPAKAGPVVHRYSGEVLLRPRTCRVTVDADETAGGYAGLGCDEASDVGRQKAACMS